MDLKNLNIAIIGAGYAGAAAAKALSIRGATVNVYEQATQIHEVGAGHRPAPVVARPVPPVGHPRRDRDG